MITDLGLMDIYLIDQLQKGRIRQEMKILDAGCGYGRNSEYFIRNNFHIYGIDRKEEAITQLKEKIQDWNPDFLSAHYTVGDLLATTFPDSFFDFIISSAVLHFAETRNEFITMFDEHARILAPGGFFFCRMTTKHTIEHLSIALGNDVYCLPDGSVRYLLDQDVLKSLMTRHKLIFAEPCKTVNVADIRTMSTLLLLKQ